jgi:hypothetical protein
LAELTPRNRRSSSIDLMIHDIDVIFKCSKIKSENISASGVSVISDTLTLLMPVSIWKRLCSLDRQPNFYEEHA